MSDIGTTPRKAMSPTRRLRIWEANSGICVLCQQKIDGTRDKWIVEHIRALGLGGEDTDANCGPAHESCADSKTHGDDIPRIAKAKRQKMKALGIRKQSTFNRPKGVRFDWSLGRYVKESRP